MDNTSSLFRTLVLVDAEFEEEFRDKLDDYYSDSNSFSFETVFYRTPYSYCCCPCAYQHEYFEYLSDRDEVDNRLDRHVDDAVFERIVQNIADGRCPHTNGVEEKYLTTSTVYTDHVLAISGSKESLKRITYNSWKKFSSIFQLHSFVSLVLKNSCQMYDYVIDAN